MAVVTTAVQIEPTGGSGDVPSRPGCPSAAGCAARELCRWEHHSGHRRHAPHTTSCSSQGLPCHSGARGALGGTSPSTPTLVFFARKQRTTISRGPETGVALYVGDAVPFQRTIYYDYRVQEVFIIFSFIVLSFHFPCGETRRK